MSLGHVYVEVVLRGLKAERSSRMFVDTGSTFSIIPRKMADELGVQTAAWKENVVLADGSVKEFDVCWSHLQLKGRGTVAKMLLSEVDEPVLGTETLETLGLMVDPVRGTVEPSRAWAARAPSRM
jgi:predicted aspartyl protease